MLIVSGSTVFDIAVTKPTKPELPTPSRGSVPALPPPTIEDFILAKHGNVDYNGHIRISDGSPKMELYQEKNISVSVRWMVRHDFAAVMKIEQESFEFPWNESEFLRCLQSRNCIGVVAEYNGEVVGFAIYETPKNEIFLTNIAVKEEYRRKGVASQIVEKLIRKLLYQNRQQVLVEIRETNLTALQCFRTLGFLSTGIIRNFYDDQNEDVYVLAYRAKHYTERTKPERQEIAMVS